MTLHIRPPGLCHSCAGPWQAGPRGHHRPGVSGIFIYSLRWRGERLRERRGPIGAGVNAADRCRSG